jgi:hypothetical protein
VNGHEYNAHVVLKPVTCNIQAVAKNNGKFFTKRARISAKFTPSKTELAWKIAKDDEGRAV